MDPDKVWNVAVFAAKRLLHREDEGTYEDERDMFDDVDALADCVVSLHNWMKAGGFPPNVFKGKEKSDG